ncbi:acyl carrier protein [Streptomyces sp. NPDC048282]|uniref:acyl carrier protein n=1 Tax=Streptomyces sp. NPDC048282 TaxID=3365528 RepID=UPI0037119B7B
MDVVTGFLKERDGSLDPSDWNRDLIEARVLSSLEFVEFLLVIEEIVGSPVKLTEENIQSFRTLGGINALINLHMEAK